MTLSPTILFTGAAASQLLEEAKRYATNLVQDARFDLLLLLPEGKSGHLAASVRSFVAQAFLPPHLGERKVLLIAEAERMLPEAAHALLKVLEEPPAHAHFCLTAEETSALLPTLLSRCRIERIQPATPSSAPPSLAASSMRELLVALPLAFPELMSRLHRLEDLLEENEEDLLKVHEPLFAEVGHWLRLKGALHLFPDLQNEAVKALSLHIRPRAVWQHLLLSLQRLSQAGSNSR